MTAGVNTFTDIAKAGMATVASPGEAFVDYGAAGSTIQGLLINSTGDAVATATQQGYTLESSFNANEITGTGYTAQGVAPGSQVVSVTAHVVKATCAAFVWSAATLTALGIFLVKHVGAAGSNAALIYYSFNATVVSTAATYTVTPNASGLFTIT